MGSSATAQQKANQDMFTLIPHYSSMHEEKLQLGFPECLL